MKTSRRYELSDAQLAAIILGSVVGAGFTTLPRLMAKDAGRDGWLSIALAGGLVWLISILIYLLCRRFPNRILPEFSIIILGRPLGILVSVAYAAYALVLGATALRVFIDMVRTWVIIWTPVWVFMLAGLLPAAYAAYSGIIVLGRVLVLIAYLLVSALALFLLPLGQFEFLSVRPVGGEDFLTILSATPSASFAFLGFEVLLVVFPFITNRQRIFRVYTLTLATITVIYMWNAVLIFGVLGIEYTQIQVWPMIKYLHIGTLPVVERVDNLFQFIWFAQVIAVVTVQYYAAASTLAAITSKRAYHLWAALLWPIVYLIAVLPVRQVTILRAEHIVGRLGMAFIAVMVSVLLLVAWLRGLDESEGALGK